MKTERFFHFEPVETQPAAHGLTQPVAAALASFVGLVFIFIEPHNRFVRYCAWMSLFVLAAWLPALVVLSVLSWFPLIGILFHLVQAVLSLAAVTVLVVMAIGAFRGYKLVIFRVSEVADAWSRPDDISPDDLDDPDDPLR